MTQKPYMHIACIYFYFHLLISELFPEHVPVPITILEVGLSQKIDEFCIPIEHIFQKGYQASHSK
jgi:hypothetical protein